MNNDMLPIWTHQLLDQVEVGVQPIYNINLANKMMKNDENMMKNDETLSNTRHQKTKLILIAGLPCLCSYLFAILE